MQKTDEELLAIAKENKIQAIKEYRESTGANFADAVTYIDNLLANDYATSQEKFRDIISQPAPIQNSKTNNIGIKDVKKIGIIFLAIIIIIGVVFGIICGISSANSSSRNATTTENSTYNQTTETTATTTTATTTTETTTKEINYPTIEEYLNSLGKYIGTNYQRTNYYSDNYVLITWSVQYNSVETFKYSLMLFLNEDETVSGCTIMTIKEKFINNFTQLLSSDQQYEVMVEMSSPAYLLACMHNNVEFNDDEYVKLLGEKIITGVYSSSKKYDNDIFDCDFSISVSDYGVTTYLDYGADKHE